MSIGHCMRFEKAIGMGEDNTARTLDERTDAAACARPFVKWAGGKHQLLTEIRKHVPGDFSRYWEPFVGGGAVFFNLVPGAATLVDANEELVNAYRVVQEDVETLIGELEKHAHNEETFYSLREWDRLPSFEQRSAVERAARFIYLNKTCFNGLYRVNSKGQFNVPFGRYHNPTIADRVNLTLCSKALRGVEVECGSFLDIETRVASNDFVYFDPPYIPLTSTSSFTSYTADRFTIDMQTALRDLCVRLDSAGVKWLLSNSSSFIIRELYSGYRITSVKAQRAINAHANKRGVVEEVLIRNF